MRHCDYRPDIDGLRAIAVLSVVGFHSFPEIVRGGFVGVDIFFVISGYLIATLLYTNLQRGTFRFSEFYSRRIRRIFPALLIVLAACLIWGFGESLPGEYKKLGLHISASAVFLSNFILWKEAGYFDEPSATKPLLHLWSLGIEEQFYLFFPALAWCAFKRRIPLTPVLLAMIGLSFGANVTGGATAADAVFYSPLTRSWELLAGALLAHRLAGMPPVAGCSAKIRSDLLSVIGLGCIGVAVFLFASGGVFPGWRGTLPVLGALLLILAGPGALVNRLLLCNRIMVWVGVISYPLYLWHWPLLVYARMSYLKVPPAEVRAGILVASVLLAWATYWFIEKRMRFGGRNKEKVTALCLLMALLGSLGFYSYTQNGFPARFPKFIQDLALTDIDLRAEWRPSRCFLEGVEQKRGQYPEECSLVTHRPVIVLWGDSHAAALYFGLKKFADKYHFSVLQYTASECPPLLDFDLGARRPYCNTLNADAISQIERIKPDFVVLQAFWTSGQDISKLQNTTSALQRLHIPKILVIGQTPVWDADISRVITNYWLYDAQHRLPPRYMQFGLSPNTYTIEQNVHDASVGLGVDYISPMETLCTTQGCLTRLGNNAHQLLYDDDNHLSPLGSDYFINSIADYFLAPP